MKTPHTQAPWSWIKDNENWFLLQNIGKQKIILKANELKGGPSIPENWEEGPLGLRLVDFDIKSPNARLIAAAPELMDMLYLALPSVEESDEFNEPTRKLGPKIRALLKKIEGEL